MYVSKSYIYVWYKINHTLHTSLTIHYRFAIYSVPYCAMLCLIYSVLFYNIPVRHIIIFVYICFICSLYNYLLVYYLSICIISSVYFVCILCLYYFARLFIDLIISFLILLCHSHMFYCVTKVQLFSNPIAYIKKKFFHWSAIKLVKSSPEYILPGIRPKSAGT